MRFANLFSNVSAHGAVGAADHGGAELKEAREKKWISQPVVFVDDSRRVGFVGGGVGRGACGNATSTDIYRRFTG